ncbi:MAG TPA: nucleoside diphosphate kinase regulator [Cyclobacteriaceae bacterium]|nr:nucleoside diphosphate kinase regulator [Cyclobacteriaceae bacterium]
MKKRMIITTNDYHRLIRLMESAPLKAKMPEFAAHLYKELVKAEMVPQERIPGNVVTMNSRVFLQEMASKREAELTITYPQDADNLKRKVSVFSRIGAALIGKQVGDVTSWATPKGNKWFEILKVTYQPEAVGDYSL